MVVTFNLTGTQCLNELRKDDPKHNGLPILWRWDFAPLIYLRLLHIHFTILCDAVGTYFYINIGYNCYRM